MNDLRSINLKQTNVTDTGLEHLSKLDSLQHLSLWYTPISDECIETLAALKGIQQIRLFGTNVSSAGADRLRESLGEEAIDFRRGAFLGVRCQPGPQGCTITFVKSGSSASAVGLRIGDVIRTYNDAPVTDFRHLTQLISQNGAGDRIEIGIDRGGKSFVKNIKLGSWQ